MSWRDRLQPGSFRDISFHLSEASGTGGRRVEVHQYPQQEEHWSEDLGLSAKTDSLEVYVIGADYDRQRAALIDALDTPGSGTLVHPHLGTLEIQVGEYTWKISTKQGGYCKFTIGYTRAGQRQFPKDQQANGKYLMDCCNAATDALQGDFTDLYAVLGKPGFVLQAAIEFLTALYSTINQLKKLEESSLATADFSAIAVDAGQLAQDIVGSVTALSGTGSIAQIIETNTELFDGQEAIEQDAAPNQLTPSRQQIQQNQQAISQLAQGIATVESARTLAARNVTLDNYAQAMDIQAGLLSQLDRLIDQSSPDTYGALANVQSAIVKRIDDIAPGLQKISHLTLQQPMPALVLAHRLYQSSLKTDDLITRNQITHPLFVPAGESLEILS